jgi:hypothetical protein
MLLHVRPPFVLRCHWMLGAGIPATPTVKVARPPTPTVAADGCEVTLAGWLVTVTVSVRGSLAAESTELVSTQRYW